MNFGTNFFKFLNRRLQRKILKWIVRSKCKNHRLQFPIDTSTVKKALIIMPQKSLEALCQASNIASILTHFSHTEFFFLCEHEVSQYVSAMFVNRKIIEYGEKELLLFSKEFNLIVKKIASEQFDMALLLDREPSLAALYFEGISGAIIRVGFDESAEYPFANILVRQPNQNIYLPDYNLTIANVLGVRHKDTLHWSVSQKSIEEASHLIRESIPSDSTVLVGLDIGYFINHFGTNWTDSMIKSLRQNFSITFYGYIQSKPEAELIEWSGSKGLPLFSNLTVPLVAALITCSFLMICGYSELFQFCYLLRKPAVAVIDNQQASYLFKKAPHLRCVCYSEKPQSSTIEAIIKAVTELNGTRFNKL